jgi:hypothetical protein
MTVKVRAPPSLEGAASLPSEQPPMTGEEVTVMAPSPYQDTPNTHNPTK